MVSRYKTANYDCTKNKGYCLRIAFGIEANSIRGVLQLAQLFGNFVVETVSIIDFRK
jgi:hypothetical protein